MECFGGKICGAFSLAFSGKLIENKKQNYKKYALQHGVFIKNKDFNSIKDNTFGFTHPQLKNFLLKTAKSQAKYYKVNALTKEDLVII